MENKQFKKFVKSMVKISKEYNGIPEIIYQDKDTNYWVRIQVAKDKEEYKE